MNSDRRFAVRPPDYFPDVGYAAMLLAVDTLVVADTWQYVRQSHHNRARIRKPGGIQWMTVPIVSGQHGRPICEIQTDDREPWQLRHLKALQYNYGATPYFLEYMSKIEQIVGAQYDSLASLTTETVRFVSESLYADVRLVRGSSMEPAADTLASACHQFEGDTLLVSAERDLGTLPESVLFDPKIAPWRQHFPGFFPNVSVLDLLFNYGPAARLHLDAALS